MRLGHFSVSRRILLVLVIGFVTPLLVLCHSLISFRETLLQARASEVRHLDEVAWMVVAGYYDRAETGAMTEEAAKEAARNAVRSLRYDKSNYYFIWDLTGTGIAHGGNPAFEGKNYISGPEAKSNPGVSDMVTKLVKVARDEKEGFTEYRIPKAGGTVALDKIGYSKLFEPWGWAVGTGAYVTDIDAIFWNKAKSALLVAGFLTALAGAFSLILARNLSHALRRLAQRIGGLANNDLETDVPETMRRDEVGAIARAMLALCERSREADKLRAEQNQSKLTAGRELEKQLVLKSFADAFERKVRGLVGSVAAGTQQMQVDATSMAMAATQTDNEAQVVSRSCSQTAGDIEVIARAAIGLVPVVRDIADKIGRSTQVTAEAIERARTANEDAHALEEASQKIGKVLTLITTIAAQTNLLALNATIEAARAGTAGKGFAVVATEVKLLAAQTARATREISDQIDYVQHATRYAVEALRSIAGAIGEVDLTAREMAIAIAAQSSATEKIISTVNRTVEEASRVAESSTSIVISTRKGEATALDLLRTANYLDQETSDLQQEVDLFVERLRG